MASRFQDTVLGGVLIALSVIWIWLAINTIPAGFGDGEIGARAFPLFFGVALLVLSVIMLLRMALVQPDAAASDSLPETEEEADIRWLAAILLLGQIVLYGYLLEKIGFVLSTPIIVLMVMFVNLRVRSPRKLLGMSLGLTVGCWVVFEKLLGIYLANGVWINLG